MYNMYILKPIIHETVWGGYKLNKDFGFPSQNAGHLYMVNGHKEMSNIIINGKYKGITLRELFQIKKSEWGYNQHEEFPLTIALVDANANLSIQVHPSDLIAGRLENCKLGKSESWLFLDPPTNGWIYNGCTCSSKEQVSEAVSLGKMEDITGRLSIKENDYVYVEAGTLHALTAGSFVYEIEFGSDYTYRFYDYDRKDEKGIGRDLHISKAVQAIIPNRKSKVINNKKFDWISEENYEIRIVTNICNYKNSGKELECLSIIEGEGQCDGCLIKSGMSLLLLPGEEVNKIRIGQGIVARIR